MTAKQISKAANYDYVLKKDLWAEFEVTALFECPDERACIRLLGLIRTSVDAKKLIPVGQKNVDFYCNNGYWFYFKPSDIINWAISKDIPLPPKLQEWYENQNKPIEQPKVGTNNLITQLCSRYHPTNGLKVYYHGMGEWVDMVKISKDPAQTDITRYGFGLTATTYFRLSHEDSITLERVGKVKTTTLFPIDPKLDARGQYCFSLPELTEFKKDDVAADIPPHEYKELCNKYYEDNIESSPKGNNERVSTPSNKYEARNIDFQAWINETKPNLDAMKKNDIQKELIGRNNGLWRSGFFEWWKQQKIYKGTAGRKKKLIE